MKKKKIAILCNYQLLPHRIGGMDNFFWAFDAQCKKEDIHVDWFFPNFEFFGQYDTFSLHSANHKPLEIFFLDYCQDTKFDLVITHFLELCTPFYKKLKKLCPCPIIAVDHNPRPIGGYTLKKKLEKKVKGFLYSKYIDVFVGVCKYTVRELSKDFGPQIEKKAIVIYNGVLIDKILTNENRSLQQPKFLVASHLRESKGIQDLIDAVNLISTEIKNNLVIDIYGEGPYKKHLLEKIELYQLHNVFHFKGSVENLNELYHNYDYLLQPTHMECFSLSILESLAANVPVITTNVGGNDEVITNGENGYILEAKDTEALKSILEKLYQGKQKIEINTRPLIENNFTIDKMVREYYDLIIKNL